MTVQRTCGSCTLCCTLVPVKELNKEAGMKCASSRSTGCKIYPSRPRSCRVWSCRWLLGDADLPRPDRAGYVVDPVADYMMVKDGDNGGEKRFPTIQVWVDPRRPDSHRDPKLRAYLHAAALEGVAAILRYDGLRSIALFAPPLTGAGWREVEAGVIEREPSELDKLAERRDLLHIVDKAVLK